MLFTMTGSILIPTLLLFCAQKVLSDEDKCVNATEVGEPLILTPYLKNGSIEMAKNLSKVTVNGWAGYSGFITVDEACGAHIFIWFIPAKNYSSDCPLFVWLQGGPGASSMYGLFSEIGPMDILNLTTGFVERNKTWNYNNHILYIDQPVGTGFSFPKNNCLAENMTVITDHFMKVMNQFYVMFPWLLSNRLILAGESYAGHYIPAFGVKILELNQNTSAEMRFNLSGIVIGNPLTRLACHNYSYFLWELGIVGGKLRDEINARHRQLELHAENGNYTDANDDWYYILNNQIGEQSKMWNRNNVGPDIADDSQYAAWLDTTEARCRLHVGNTTFNDTNWVAYVKLVADIARPYDVHLANITNNNISTWIYSGNLDMICLTTSTNCLLRGLNWWGAEGFLAANRTPFFDVLVAGWTQHYGPLKYVVFKDAGHSVPRYKPEMCYNMINSIDYCPSDDPFCYFNFEEP